VIRQLKSENPEIEIEETQERIKIPLKALKLLGEVLKAMSEGKPFSIVPMATEVTTQKAAEILGCSRPHFVKLLEEGKIEFTKVGKHRRVRFEDVMKYKRKMKKDQKQHLIDIMKSDEELGLYDS
ncbi:MAG TPA: helix-turn-helix domain-containing protein, partial [Salegentibacter sp.]